VKNFIKYNRNFSQIQDKTLLFSRHAKANKYKGFHTHGLTSAIIFPASEK